MWNDSRGKKITEVLLLLVTGQRDVKEKQNREVCCAPCHNELQDEFDQTVNYTDMEAHIDER
jgi:hypothetical protein